MTQPHDTDTAAALLASLVHDMPFVGMALVAPATGQWLQVSDRLCELLGFSREELLESAWSQQTCPDDLARYELVMAGEECRLEKRFVGKGGGSIATDVHLKCLCRSNDRPGYLLLTVRDIGEGKRAEDAWRDAEDFRRAILDAVSAHVAVLDQDGVIVAVNKPWRKFAQENSDHKDRISPTSDIGTNYLDVCRSARGESAEGALAVHEGIRAVLEGRVECFSHEYPCHAPGLLRWYVLNVTPLSGGHGGAVVSHTDISATRKLSESLRAANARLTRAQRSAGAGIWEWDMPAQRFDWSDELFHLFGLDPAASEASLETWRGVVHADDIQAAEARIRVAMENHTPLESEYRIVLPSGMIRWISALGDSTFAADGRPLRMSGICLDITSRKQAEALLRAERDTSQRYLDTVEAIIVALDSAGRITLMNRKGHALLGYAPGELVGADWFECCLPQPEGKTQVHPVFRQLMSGELANVEYFENPVLTRVGERRLIAWHNTLLHDEAGTVIGVLSAGEDITERRRAEEALLDAARRKDEFLAMLAHELRNPLAPIRNAAYVLGQLRLEEPRVKWAQEIIERQVAHLSRLVDDLLDVSRIVRGKVTLQTGPIDLANLVRHAIESTRPLMEVKGHHLHVVLPQELISLEGDQARLTQVLVNLLDNAAKYTPEGGHIALTAEVKDGGLELVVQDDGLGMPKDLLPRVFDLFSQGERTLDRAQGGLGIGLTLVKNLVEMHGGQVTASSSGTGHGSVFTVRLPLAACSPVSLPNESPPQCSGGQGKRILVVDDEPTVAESTAVFLEVVGHEVRTAASGEGAMRVIAAFHPQVVLLDIGLPGQDGFAVARQIRALPDGGQFWLVALSGYGSAEVVSHCRAAGFDEFLLKPVNPATLINKIEAHFPERLGAALICRGVPK